MSTPRVVYHLRRSCTSKVQYPNEGRALAAIRALSGNRRYGPIGAGGLQSYSCEFCGQWHIGHPPKQKAPE